MSEKKKGPSRKLTRIWCPLRTCVHNVNMRCISPTIKLHLAASGKMVCNTYRKRSGWPPALDYFKKEIQEGWIEDHTDGEQLDFSPDKLDSSPKVEAPSIDDTSTQSESEDA